MTRVTLLAACVSCAVGCDFLPQDETEWTIALSVAGGLVLAAVIAAWRGMKKNR